MFVIVLISAMILDNPDVAVFDTSRLRKLRKVLVLDGNGKLAARYWVNILLGGEDVCALLILNQFSGDLRCRSCVM